MEHNGLITGIAHDFNVAKVVVFGIPDIPGTAANVFRELAKSNINIQMIVQSSQINNKNDIAFTCSLSDARDAKNILENIAKELGAENILIEENLAKVSIVGAGMMTHSNIASQMFEALAKSDINIDMISTSEITISVIVDSSQCEKAVKALAEEFKLV